MNTQEEKPWQTKCPDFTQASTNLIVGGISSYIGLDVTVGMFYDYGIQDAEIPWLSHRCKNDKHYHQAAQTTVIRTNQEKNKE